MGTRARIAVKIGDTYRTIYTHWDGYPSHHFPILTKHYASQAEAERLVSFGDASSLEKRCVPVGAHSYDRPEDGCTIYYGRDRGEEGAGFRDVAHLREVQAEEYLYIWDGERWGWCRGKDVASICYTERRED